MQLMGDFVSESYLNFVSRKTEYCYVGHTSTHLITEIKQCWWARIVLG
jgi:hypothetical protein